MRSPHRGFGCVGFVACLLLVGCGNKVTDRNVRIVETPGAALEVMTKSRGALGMKGPPNAVWLDPRPAQAFAEAHIPGAINLPFAILEAEADTVLKNVDVIVVYDADYDSTLGMAVAKRLISLGFKETYLLRGGLKAWRRDGNRVETGGIPAG